MNQREQQLLLELLALPTAPYREVHVQDFIRALLDRRHVPWFEDPLGNLVIGPDSPAAYRRLLAGRQREPVRLYVAHMDHPGFHGSEWLTPRRLRFQWHGGSPTRLLRGSRMWLADEQGELAHGTLGKTTLASHGFGLDSGEISFPAPPLRDGQPVSASKLFGGFGFKKPVSLRGRRLYTRAADDMAGVFCILATALQQFSPRRRAGTPPFIGLLTRAEETGFVGAVGHLELGWLQRAKRPICGISLEASRTLPGAIIGKGPVIRLGDRRTVFNADYLQVLSTLAEKHLPRAHQRRLMDGGACEGTALTAWGIPVIAMSVPLGNYHNEGYEGGPECRGHRGPAPEIIHLDDVAGELLLCKKLMAPKLPWDQPWSGVQKVLKKRLDMSKGLL